MPRVCVCVCVCVYVSAHTRRLPTRFTDDLFGAIVNRRERERRVERDNLEMILFTLHPLNGPAGPRVVEQHNCRTLTRAARAPAMAHCSRKVFKVHILAQTRQRQTTYGARRPSAGLRRTTAHRHSRNMSTGP